MMELNCFHRAEGMYPHSPLKLYFKAIKQQLTFRHSSFLDPWGNLTWYALKCTLMRDMGKQRWCVLRVFVCHLERHLWDWVWVSAYAVPALRFCSMVHLAALAFQFTSSPIPVMQTLIIEAICGNQHYVLDSSI